MMRQSTLRFSSQELSDLIKSMLVIGAAYTVATVGITHIITLNFIEVFLIALVTVGLGFILHELAHKIVAQRYGCWSEYWGDDRMLIFTVILSFMGILFAAPGAVHIHGALSKKQLGIISSAGPITNVLLAGVFLIFLLLGIYPSIAGIGLSINSWLALFNMIPIGPFDGVKILKWNKIAYTAIVAAAFALYFLRFA